MHQTPCIDVVKYNMSKNGNLHKLARNCTSDPGTPNLTSFNSVKRSRIVNFKTPDQKLNVNQKNPIQPKNGYLSDQDYSTGCQTINSILKYSKNNRQSTPAQFSTNSLPATPKVGRVPHELFDRDFLLEKQSNDQKFYSVKQTLEEKKRRKATQGAKSLEIWVKRRNESDNRVTKTAEIKESLFEKAREKVENGPRVDRSGASLSLDSDILRKMIEPLALKQKFEGPQSGLQEK